MFKLDVNIQQEIAMIIILAQVKYVFHLILKDVTTQLLIATNVISLQLLIAQIFLAKLTNVTQMMVFAKQGMLFVTTTTNAVTTVAT
jgi:hypothetical protein